MDAPLCQGRGCWRLLRLLRLLKGLRLLEVVEDGKKLGTVAGLAKKP